MSADFHDVGISKAERTPQREPVFDPHVYRLLDELNECRSMFRRLVAVPGWRLMSLPDDLRERIESLAKR